MARIFIILIAQTMAWTPVLSWAFDLKDNVFYGLEVGGGNIDFGDTDESAKDLGLVVGYELSRFLALEVHLGAASDDSSSLLNDAQLTRVAGFARLNYPGNNLNAYLLGGISSVQYDMDNLDDTEGGIAWGAGVDLFGNETTSLTITIVRHQGDDVDYNVAKLGYRYYFGGNE